LSNSHFTVGFSIPALVKRMRILIIEGEGIQIRIDEIKNIAKLSFNNLKHQALVNHQL
jgi:hypothetical protein